MAIIIRLQGVNDMSTEGVTIIKDILKFESNNFALQRRVNYYCNSDIKIHKNNFDKLLVWVLLACNV